MATRKKSDPALCQHIIEVLRTKGRIVAYDWSGVRHALGLPETVALRKVKIAAGSLCYKQRKVSLRRTRNLDEPLSDYERGYEMTLV